ncbi:PAS domain S-box protein [Pokkaliibacter plantistimulans]|uniref:PAS domain S-box protein n=1 Tax=Pokkaliibacter plantistimulans TaxID=1635171 RepID=UPI001FAE908C|nr:PAS domain S-box protein [Pokkaliibacter plantistimulans]
MTKPLPRYQPAVVADNEAARLAALQSYAILDTAAEQAFDDVTELAAQICGVPISLISLVDKDRQWFKSCLGLEARETPRDMAFCAHAILSDELLIIPDAKDDDRFADNPLVIGPPHIRFYAGAPLITPGGLRIGTLCVIDQHPRDLNPAQCSALKRLARQVINKLELLQKLKREQALEAMARHQTSTALRHQRALRALNDIAGLPGNDRLASLRYALALGSDYFQLPYAIISRIVEDDYEVLLQYSPPDTLQDHQHFSLGITYCQLVTERGGTIAIHHMRDSVHARHPCYTHFKLETYIGTPIMVDGGIYGTLNFSSPEPRQEPFDEAELEFLRLFARWVGTMLEQHLHDQQQRSALQRLQKIAAHVPGMVFQYRRRADGSRHFPYISEGVRDIYGLSPKELNEDASAVFGLIHEDDVEETMNSIQQSADTLQPWHHQYRAHHPQKGLIWLDGNATPERLEDGSILWHGFITDITERRHQQEEISRSRAYLQAILDSSTGVAMIATDPLGTISFFNTGAERLLGYSAEELVGKTSPAIFHVQAEMEAHGRYLSKLYGYPISGFEVFVTQAQTEGSETRQWTYICKNGEARQVRLTTTRIQDSEGNIQGFLGVAIDMTQLIKTSEALQESENRYRGMLQNLPGMVYRRHADPWQPFSYCSDAFSDLTGYALAQLSAQTPASLIHPADQQRVQAQIEEAISRQLAYDISYQLLHADGRLIWVQDRGRAEYDEHGQLRWLDGFLQDISERRKVELMKSEFVSIISHELRTPLTSIYGALDLIHGQAVGQAPAAMSSMLDVAWDNSQRLCQLVDDLLDMDKIVAGKLSIHPRRQPLPPIITEACRSSSGYASKYQVHFHIGPLADVEVMVDSVRLHQVLLNLLSNAAKFSHQGGRVDIGTEWQDGQVKVWVQDQGCGIPAVFQTRLFQKFSQVDASSTRRAGGTGLGLAISRELVEQMGGQIGFDSEEGQGSTFWFVLPILSSTGESVAS